MDERIIVSIIVPVYNHENYINECLSGILKQKVDFKYEVWIGEDCSNDNSRKVLKELEKEMPDCFHFIYREKNMGMGCGGNAADLYLRATGKYCITCDGDDYWSDDNKLQKQVDFLEQHPEYIAISHDCFIVDEKSNIINEEYPTCKDLDYSFESFITACMPGQTATILFRREEYLRANEDFIKKYQVYHSFPGDRKKAFILLCHGKIRCSKEKMSAYRHVQHSGSSFSATVKKDWDKYYFEQFLFYESIFNYARYLENADAIDATKKLYYYALLKYSVGKRKKYSLINTIEKLLKENGRLKLCLYIIKRQIVTIAYFKFHLPVNHERYFI